MGVVFVFEIVATKAPVQVKFESGEPLAVAGLGAIVTVTVELSAVVAVVSSSVSVGDVWPQPAARRLRMGKAHKRRFLDGIMRFVHLQGKAAICRHEYPGLSSIHATVSLKTSARAA
jgi:hypothetical protein